MKKGLAKIVSVLAASATIATLSGCIKPSVIEPEPEPEPTPPVTKVIAQIPQQDWETKLGLFIGDFVSDGQFGQDGSPDIGYILQENRNLYAMEGNSSFLSPKAILRHSKFGDRVRKSGVGWAAYDYDHDGDPDLFKLNINESWIQLLENLGNGNFKHLEVFATFPLGNLLPLPGYTHWNCEVGLAAYDRNNDGLVDFDIALPTSPPDQSCSSPTGCKSGSCNEISIYHLENLGGGSFALHPGPILKLKGYRWNSGWDIARYDFDSDGLPDLFVVKGSTGNVIVYFNRGNL